jgi:hypothetical protein
MFTKGVLIGARSEPPTSQVTVSTPPAAQVMPVTFGAGNSECLPGINYFYLHSCVVIGYATAI